MRYTSRGAALLLVLWLLVLLTGLVSVFALTARTENLQGRFLERSTAARYAAEAGIELAVLRLYNTDKARQWVPDGRVNSFGFEGQQIQVQIVDETAKVDLNAANAQLLSDLMLALGIDTQKAAQISGAIVDFRDPDDLLNAVGGAEDPQYASAKLPYGAKDGPFETVSELQQVLGMDQALYQKLLPYVTIYTGSSRPDPRFASEPVLNALGLPEVKIAQILAKRSAKPDAQGVPTSLGEAASLVTPGTGTYSISSRAAYGDGTQAEINATVRLGANGVGRLYMPLSWRVGGSD